MQPSARLHPRLLLLIPLLTYALSYAYLAIYHGHFWLFPVVVHESGIYTLWQEILYASHFLGHVPVHTVLAFVFTGAYLCLTSPARIPARPRGWIPYACAVLLFVAVAFVLSVWIFGREDTLSFLAQQKQGPARYVPGGSWNLHLPSTEVLLLLIPGYIWLLKRTLGCRVCVNSSGIFFVVLSAFLMLLLTCEFNGGSPSALWAVWTDPRYLAHSVREMATFPLTYFPLPLYFFLRDEAKTSGTPAPTNKRLLWIVVIAGFCGFVLVTYQALTALHVGIGTLAQHPSFTKGNALPVPYLLASHYFEHVLDTIYFTLFCLLLWKAGKAERTA